MERRPSPRSVHLRDDLRLSRKRERHIGERAQRDQNDSRIRLDSFNDGVDRVPVRRGLTRSGIVVISKSIAAMKPGCVLIGAEERLVGAGVNRHLRAAEFDRVESVAGRLRKRNIPGDSRYRRDADIRRAQRHDQRNGIIGSCVGIDKESSRHAARITNYSGRARAFGLLRRPALHRIVTMQLAAAEKVLHASQPDLSG